MSPPTTISDGIRALRGFARAPAPRAAQPCELCGLPLGDEHWHLWSRKGQTLVCACDACAFLFSFRDDQSHSRVPRAGARLDEFQVTDQQWASLGIPVNLAFIVRRSAPERHVGYYPSPGGAVEFEVDREAWHDIFANAGLQIACDVEAILVDRLVARPVFYRLPIDQCFKLVALVRANWQGLTGGPGVPSAIADFLRRFDSPTPQTLAAPCSI